MIGFNKPFLTGNETKYIIQAVNSGKISGNGDFTKRCQSFFETRYGFKKCLLTTSCTDALEMTALLLDIEPGDEVIMPSFTFVSTALAFVRQGAKIVFADSRTDQPNIDEDSIEALITPKTKAIVIVHYAGVACNMDKIMKMAQKYSLFVVEDAAQAIDSFYHPHNTINSSHFNNQQTSHALNQLEGYAELNEQPFDYAQGTNELKKHGEQKEPGTSEPGTKEPGTKEPLGSIGHLSCFSFHETKNIHCGEGGMLVINDERFAKRAEILWEKGTNRAAFWRGEINKYGWVDTGSSFLPSDMLAAFLYAQLEKMGDIQNKRLKIWQTYYDKLKVLQDKGFIKLPHIPQYASNNAHMFYILCRSLHERTLLIDFLKENQVAAVFHYLPLHKSAYYKSKHDGRNLKNAIAFSNTILRLPFFYKLNNKQIKYICNLIIDFYKGKAK